VNKLFYIEKYDRNADTSCDRDRNSGYGSYVTVDAHVTTGCPRITTDDGPQFKKPMLTPGEYEIAVGNKPLEELSFDTFHGTW
jgi:diphthamide synthase subunit DPH2